MSDQIDKLRLDDDGSPPEVPEWEIWSAGFLGRDPMVLHHGKCRGLTFRDAVLAFAAKFPDFKDDLDPENLTLHSRRLFDNESAARISVNLPG